MPSFTRLDLGLDTPATTRQEREPRRLSVAATLLALSFTLLWPVALGLAAGVAAALWWSDLSLVKVGLVLGIAAGVALSGAALLGSYVVNVALHRAPVTEAASPAQVVMNYAPLSEQRDNIRIVPLRSFNLTVDDIPARDLAWFCQGLSLGKSHAQRAWVGQVSPSGRLVDAHYWRALSRPLRKAWILVDDGPRRSGRLVTRNLDVMIAQLGMPGDDTDLWAF